MQLVEDSFLENNKIKVNYISFVFKIRLFNIFK